MSGRENSDKPADQALNRMKFEVANSMGINIRHGNNGDLTARQAGSVGGEMVRRMIQQYENLLGDQRDKR